MSIQKPQEPNFAQKRLLKDLHEVETSPHPLIFAAPLEKNIFEWHANLIGPQDTKFKDHVYHIILNFSNQYPKKPPTAQLTIKIPRSHVFDQWICLDMLETHSAPSRFSGWSSSYTVLTILIQLHSWLFYDDELHLWQLEARIKDVKESNRLTDLFVCKNCPHNMLVHKPWPKTIHASKVLHDKEMNSNKPNIPLGIIPDEVVIHIFSYLTSHEIHTALGESNPKLAKIIGNFHLIQKSETICFHSKVSFEHDVIGYGISINWVGNLCKFHSPLEFISQTTFYKENVRNSVWREHFTHFLPLYINKEHGKVSLPLAEVEIAKIYNVNKFEPLLAMDCLSKLMTTQVVEVMRGSVHASIKALEGYCQFHRLLIAFVQKYPELLKVVDRRVERFCSDEKYRHKNETPNMGEFLCLLSVSTHTWKEISIKVIPESFCRNALWILKDNPKILTFDDEKFLEMCFNATKVSRNLIMFNVFFLTFFARPQGKSLDEIARMYDVRYGNATNEQKELLQKGIFELQKTNSFEAYFKKIQISLKGNLVTILKKSFEGSLIRGYHSKNQVDMRPESQGQDHKSDRFDSEGKNWLEMRREFQSKLKLKK